MGFLAPVLSAAETGATAVGTTLADVGSTLGSLFTGSGGAGAAGGAGTAGGAGAGGLAGGSGALAGLSNIGQAITGAGAPSEAGYLASLGQAVPAGVDLVGPSSTFAGPGFMQGFVQGFTGAAAPLASPSAGTSAGTGLGQLFDALSNLPQAQMPGNQAPQPVVHLGDVAHAATRLLSPGPPGQPAKGPIMSMIGQLLAGF